MAEIAKLYHYPGLLLNHQEIQSDFVFLYKYNFLLLLPKLTLHIGQFYHRALKMANVFLRPLHTYYRKHHNPAIQNLPNNNLIRLKIQTMVHKSLLGLLSDQRLLT
ncbi:hypothetical protein D3C85_1263720 [compost metagenome]